MRAKWKIMPVRSSGPVGYKWCWARARNGKVIEQSTEQFDYYYDCVVDAQKHGLPSRITTAPVTAT